MENLLQAKTRDITFLSGYSHTPGHAVIAASGNTVVQASVSIESGVPRFLKDVANKQGWLTAEYAMLPSSTHDRTQRESSKGRQSPRSLEIQRFISRSLRSMIDLTQIPNTTITIDCDVLKADGSTRTTAVNAASVALVQALRERQYRKTLNKDPLRYLIGAISVGLKGHEIMADLNYQQDSSADTDMNVVANADGDLIEIQATAEGLPFSHDQLNRLTTVALDGIARNIAKQRAYLNA